MSGHSKWASIKHKKAAADAKKGKIFTKIIKEITIAAREGGGNLDANIRLRSAVNKAKEANMPQDNIDRAIKKGTGELPGVNYESFAYEGYGPKGVAILVDVVTDNKNRTTAEVRNIFSKKGGNMAGAGSVSWLFTKKGYFIVKKDQIDENKLTELALEAGAEDIKLDEDNYEITCDPNDFEKIKDFFVSHKLNLALSEITMIPSSNVKVEDEDAKQVLELVENLEDHDDVQNVYANFDIPDEMMEK